MTKTFEAVVQGNLIRPLGPFGLLDNERLLVTVVPLGQGAPEDGESCYDAADRLGILGVAKGTPPDLSSNPDHLDGFGT